MCYLNFISRIVLDKKPSVLVERRNCIAKFAIAIICRPFVCRLSETRVHCSKMAEAMGR